MELTLYRKYRPQTFADLSAQEHVKQTLQNQLKSGKVAHAYLFTGPRGVGKTTTARLIAKAVNCEGTGVTEPCNVCSACLQITGGRSLDVYEIDAASNTGVDHVRENIIESVRFAPNVLKFKVYIIDEVHMLSTSAFNALLKTLEEPPAHALFILATTEIHKVPATIVSRCQRFDFARISAKDIVKRLKEICEKEGVKVDEPVLFEIARHAQGGARDAESLLGQLLALGEKNIGVEEASLVLPQTHVLAVISFLDVLSAHETAGALRFLNEQVEQGVEMGSFLDGVVSMLRTVLFVKFGGLERFQEEFDEETQSRLKKFADAWTASELTQVIEVFLDAKRASKIDAIPQLAAELAVVKLSDSPSLRAIPSEEIARPAAPFGRASSSRGVTSRNDKKTNPANFNPQEAASMCVEIPPLPEGGLGGVGASPTVLGDIPLLSLDEVQQKWPEVFQKIQSCNASLPLIMQAGALSGVSEGVVELRFEYALHAETVNRPKNKHLVESILAEVLGKTVRMNAVHSPATQTQDETVTNLLQEFGGQAI